MIRYLPINLDEIKKQAFDAKSSKGKVLLLQDLLKRMHSIKRLDKLKDENFEFVQNPISGEIKMLVN